MKHYQHVKKAVATNNEAWLVAQVDLLVKYCTALCEVADSSAFVVEMMTGNKPPEVATQAIREIREYLDGFK